MDLKNKKILITGADGFIGSHLTEALLKAGLNIRPFVLYNSLNSWGWLDYLPEESKKELDVVAGDIRDHYGIKQAMKGCDVVFHLAALVAIPYSYNSPSSYVDTNIKGTLNILQAARELELEKIVHTSTSEVYGTAQFVPITEEHPLQGQSPYSASKIGADHLAISFYNSFGMPVTIIRPFNTYGPRQSARAVIPTVITQIASSNSNRYNSSSSPSSIKIKLGAIEPTRDFNYITDTVNGFIAIASSDRSIGEIINIGSNYEISIGDLVNLIAELMGVEVEIETDIQRIRPKQSEVERLLADNTKAKNLLGWNPSYYGRDGLKRGLTETIAWFTDPQNLVLYKTNRYNI